MCVCVCVCVRKWPKLIALNENTYLVFIYSEELLHWSVSTEREREKLIEYIQSALYVIAGAMNSG